MYVILKGRIILKKEKLKRIARRITAFAAAAAMAATLAFPTGTELLGINFGTSVVASAETTTDGNFDYTVNESTGTITKYNGSGGEVEIPATIGGNTVTSIGAEAFKDCTSLTSVAIPEGVSSIGADAFSGCSSLRSITIPDSVTSIGEYAFHSCTSLESINIPDSVTKIDRYTFTNCTSLSVITIPKNVTSIASSAFMACSGLSSINVAEENTKYISDDGVLFNKNKTELLFYPANKDGTSYAIPDGVTTIESIAFYKNNNLVSITIPDGVTNIGACAFGSCKKLTSVSIPASVNNIGIDAFNSCESLTAISVHENNSVYSSENDVLFDKNKTILVVYPAGKSGNSYTVPNTVKHIFMNSFAGCVNLENITLNEGVEKIYPAAFMGCTNLKSINIPSSVTALGDRAFMSCTSLTEISVHADNSNYSSEDGVLFDKNKTKLIVYPGGKSDTSYSVPSSVTSVYSMAFLMCPNLESIAFPPSVTSFGYSVIFGCEKLASVFVPERAAFTNQIDPATMFTSEVRYAVSDDKANITGIELGTGQTTVDIPEKISGYPVVSVAGAYQQYVGNHTHYFSNNICGLCSCAEYVTGITVSPDTLSFTVGDPASQLTAAVVPANALDTSVEWTSSDTSVAAVDDNGNVTAVGKGTATIKATAMDGSGIYDECAVTVFELIDSYTITATAGAGGSISPSGSVTVSDNDSQTFTITPDSGYEIDTLTVDGSTVTATTSYTFTNVTEDHTIYVTFKQSHTHSYGTEWKSDSTSHWHECKCGDKADIAQHISNDGVVTVQPTATSTGLRVYSCSVCGYVLSTETIPATGYSYPTYPTYVPPVITTSIFTAAPEVEAEVNGSTVTLKWDEIKNADKYYVYQYKDGKYVRVKTTTDTTVTFKNLKNGETYKFLVRYTINGKLSPTSYSGKITVKVYYKPIPKPTATKNSIKLTWEAVPEAEKYAIYKYVDGKAVKLTETKKLSVKIGKLTPDTEYKYIVRAYVDGKWTTMLKSDIVTVKTTAE